MFKNADGSAYMECLLSFLFGNENIFVVIHKYDVFNIFLLSPFSRLVLSFLVFPLRLLVLHHHFHRLILFLFSFQIHISNLNYIIRAQIVNKKSAIRQLKRYSIICLVRKYWGVQQWILSCLGGGGGGEIYDNFLAKY